MRSRRRILVVDDEVAIHEIIAEYLRGRGMEVDVGRSGREARALLASSHFDLLLTDLKLSDTDGVDLVRLANRQSPPVPAIVMTGYGTVESAVTALRSGAQDYILKPFRLKEVFAAVERAIDSGRVDRETVFLSAAVAFFERAELARSTADADALLPALTDAVALLPGVESAVIASEGAEGPGAHDVGGGRFLVLSPPTEAAVPYALAARRAWERCQA